MLIEAALNKPTEAERQAALLEARDDEGSDGYARKLREAKLAISLEKKLLQGRDPRALPQHRAVRRLRLRRRGRRPALLQQARQGPDVPRGRDDRRHHAVAVRVGPDAQPREVAGAPQHRAQADGAAGLHHRRPSTPKGVATPLARHAQDPGAEARLHVRGRRRSAARATSATTSPRSSATNKAFGKTQDDAPRAALPRRPDDQDHAGPQGAARRRQAGQEEPPRQEQVRPRLGSIVDRRAGHRQDHRDGAEPDVQQHERAGQDRDRRQLEHRQRLRRLAAASRPARRSSRSRCSSGCARATASTRPIDGRKFEYPMSAFNAPCTNLAGAAYKFGNAGEGESGIMSVLKATQNSVNSAYIAHGDPDRPVRHVQGRRRARRAPGLAAAPARTRSCPPTSSARTPSHR